MIRLFRVIGYLTCGVCDKYRAECVEVAVVRCTLVWCSHIVGAEHLLGERTLVGSQPCRLHLVCLLASGIVELRHSAEDSQRAVNPSFGCGNSRDEKVVRHVEAVAEVERTSSRKRLVDEERGGTVAHANSERSEFYLRTHHVLGLSLYLLAKDSVRPHSVARCRRLLTNQRDGSKPKGRFFRSVKLYLTDIMIDICYNWRKFWQKNGARGLLHLATSDESDLSDLSDTNLLTRQLANLLTR